MTNSILDEFKYKVLRSDNTLLHLIFINVMVFVVLGLVNVIMLLAGGSYEMYVAYIQRWLALPSDLWTLATRPWTFITYQFMHSMTNWFHLIFNMLVLYWFGRIFQEYLGNQKLLATYLLGGLAGGVIFLLAYNVLPVFTDALPYTNLIGASASVLAILVGAATLLPDYSIRLLLIGNVRLKYIALVLVVIDLLSLAGSNSGGHFAHLGGAIWGFVYIKQLQAGNDLGRWLTVLLQRIKGLFSRDSSFKVHRSKGSSKPREQKKKSGPDDVSQERIDEILDKISTSGYDSLTEREKEILFRASNR